MAGHCALCGITDSNVYQCRRCGSYFCPDHIIANRDYMVSRGRGGNVICDVCMPQHSPYYISDRLFDRRMGTIHVASDLPPGHMLPADKGDLGEDWVIRGNDIYEMYLRDEAKKPFVCSCGKRYMTLKSLRRHLAKHDDHRWLKTDEEVSEDEAAEALGKLFDEKEDLDMVTKNRIEVVKGTYVLFG